jgi:hypothetical protein
MRLGGCIPDDPATMVGDPVASALLVGSASGAMRPASWDWLYHVKRIYDQGQTNSCVGHAVAAAAGLQARIVGMDVDDGSPWGAYTLGRMAYAGPGGALSDEGARPRVTMAALRDFGIPPADRWQPPANVELRKWISRRMDDEWGALANGAQYRIEHFHWVDDAPEKRAERICDLAWSGFPTCMAIANDASLQECHDMTPLPAPVGDIDGSHYVYCVGFHNGCPMVVNSWGKGSGQGGVLLLSPERIAHPTTTSIAAIGVDEF